MTVQDAARPVRGLRPRYLSFRAICVFLMLATGLASMAAAADSDRDILIVFKDMSQLPANQLILRGFRDALAADEIPGQQIFDEYLDTPHFPGPEHLAAVAQYFKAKYAATKIEVVVAAGDEALEFVIQQKARLFPNAKIVFTGVGEESAAKAVRLLPESTGIVSELNPVKSLELALKLQPETRHVAVVTGVSGFDKSWKAAAQDRFRDKESKYDFIYLSGLPMDQLLAKVAKLPPQTVIVYLSVFEDGRGQQFIPRVLLEKVSAVANAPVYGVYDTFVGHGIVGGYMDTFEAVGKAAGNLVLRMLATASGTIASPSEAETHRYIVDWHQLERWGLDGSALPPDTEIRFKPPTIWQAYRTQVLIGLCVLALQSLAVAGLLFQVYRRRQAERTLKESEERIAFAAASTKTGMWHLDIVSNGVWATEHCRSMFGLPENEPLSLASLLGAMHPEDRSWMSEAVRSAVETGRPIDGEIRVVLPNGELTWLAVRGRPRLNDHHKLARISGIFADITSRKHAEAETDLQRRELAHLTRVSMIGELSGAIAHELTQPLTAMLANAEAAQALIVEKKSGQESVLELIDEIVRENTRASEVISRLRSLLKKGEHRRESVDLNELVESTLRLLNSELVNRQVRIRTDLTKSLPTAAADPIQVQQVLLNLMMNAIEAMNSTPAGDRWLAVSTRANGSRTIEAVIADRGPGIAEDDRDRLFRPFYTTKEHGMGLGLSICSTIVKSHGGTLSLGNNAGGGACAVLALPIPCRVSVS